MKNVFLIIILCSCFNTKGQGMADYIPDNTQYIFSYNPGRLDAKSNQLNYTNYLQPFIRENRYSYYRDNSEQNCVPVSIKDMIENPDSFGIDISSDIFIYRTSVKKISGTVYLFKLNNPASFRNKIEVTCSDPFKIQQKDLASGIYIISNQVSVAINDKVAVVFVKDYNYYSELTVSAYNDHSYADSIYISEKSEYNISSDSLFYLKLNSTESENYELEVLRQRQSEDTGIVYRAKQREIARKTELMNKNFAEILSLMESFIQSKQNHMGKNRNFTKLLADSHDAFIYLNTLAVMDNDLFSPFRSMRYAYDNGEEPEYINKPARTLLTGNISTSYSIDFENGSATVKFLNTYNENVYPYMKRSYGVKQNKNLLKYIDGDNLLGYMSVAVNAKELAKFYEEFYFELLENIPKRNSEMNILPAMRLAYAFIDKEMLYNTLDGRAILACTGFTDIKMKYSTYTYDEEFNRKEITEERMVRQPRMVMAASIGNKENAKKMFDILSSFDVFVKIKENVFAFYGDRHIPFNLYFSLTEDAFVMSNDGSLFTNPLKSGKFASADIKNIMGHNFAFKINADKMMEGIRDTYFKGLDTMPWFAELMAKLGNLEMYDSKPAKDQYGATAVIHLKDNSSNALYQLLKMMQAANGN